MKKHLIFVLVFVLAVLFSCQNGEGKEKSAESGIKSKSEAVISPVKSEKKEESMDPLLNLKLQPIYYLFA